MLFHTENKDNWERLRKTNKEILDSGWWVRKHNRKLFSFNQYGLENVEFELVLLPLAVHASQSINS